MSGISLSSTPEHERPIVRGLLRHIVAGTACGLALGFVLLESILLMFGGLHMEVPTLYVGAALLQFSYAGGFVGVGVYLTKISEPSDEDWNDPGRDDRPDAGESPDPFAG